MTTGNLPTGMAGNGVHRVPAGHVTGLYAGRQLAAFCGRWPSNRFKNLAGRPPGRVTEG